MLVLRIIATVLLGISFLVRITDWKVRDWADMIAVLLVSGTWRAFVIVLLWLL